MDSENDHSDENDDTNCELVSLLMKDRTSTNEDNAKKCFDETPEYASLSNVPCNDYIVPCDDDILMDLSEDDDNGNEIIREIELIAPTKCAELNRSESRGLNDLIVDCIQDEKIKNELLNLNRLLETNIDRCNKVAAEATTVLLEKKSLMKEFKLIEEKLKRGYSRDDAKLKKIKKKKGKHCAETSHHYHTYFRRFGIPYFKDKERYPTESNRDIIELNNQNQIMLYKLPKTRRFLRKDAQTLDSLVLQQLTKKRIEQLNGYLKDINKEIQLADDNSKEDELLERKKKIQDAIKETSKVSNLKDTKDWNLKVDFTSFGYDNYHRYSAEDYERLWNLLANPKLSRDEFTPDETSKLKELVKKYGAQNWDRIAQLLNTNRSAFMCFTKYVSIIKKGKNIPWTREEDELLRKLGSKINTSEKTGSLYHWWRNIRRHFPNRTYNAIHAHWSYVLAPKLKKGRYTKKEHTAIMKYKKQGKTYSEIAKLIGTRSCVQIRSHVENCESANSIKNGPWTRDEEDTLLELIREYGDKSWVKISKMMKTRNRTQCRLKYSQMKNNPGSNARDESSSEDGFRKGRWTDEENELFAELLKKYGHNWSKISKLLKTRSRFQCAVKYKNDLKMEQKKSKAEKKS